MTRNWIEYIQISAQRCPDGHINVHKVQRNDIGFTFVAEVGLVVGLEGGSIASHANEFGWQDAVEGCLPEIYGIAHSLMEQFQCQDVSFLTAWDVESGMSASTPYAPSEVSVGWSLRGVASLSQNANLLKFNIRSTPPFGGLLSLAHD